jgi:hypothetical protein
VGLLQDMACRVRDADGAPVIPLLRFIDPLCCCCCELCYCSWSHTWPRWAGQQLPCTPNTRSRLRWRWRLFFTVCCWWRRRGGSGGHRRQRRTWHSCCTGRPGRQRRQARRYRHRWCLWWRCWRSFGQGGSQLQGRQRRLPAHLGAAAALAWPGGRPWLNLLTKVKVEGTCAATMQTATCMQLRMWLHPAGEQRPASCT